MARLCCLSCIALSFLEAYIIHVGFEVRSQIPLTHASPTTHISHEGREGNQQVSQTYVEGFETWRHHHSNTGSCGLREKHCMTV
ncbi:hypothetical protein DFP72DRAFT_629812 [Ephemerocybe angulata]|uniref:Secreted protein n=1 Tax=Ephemerocybe angulata TaxID=980116 RepID=A0A8H6IA65_9AGAR|nr:hypothetical protein DFP72DRAFT_629812 [Tulosesus angulatus]